MGTNKKRKKDRLFFSKKNEKNERVLKRSIEIVSVRATTRGLVVRNNIF